MTALDLRRVTDDVRWLIEHPEFEERPPSILEFCGPEYLNIRKHLRKRIAKELLAIFGEEFTPGRIAKYSEAIITGGVGIGKGQCAQDFVHTLSGMTKLADLRAGDQVIGSDGRPTAVTGVYRRGVLPVYRVEFSDGASLVVDGDHLWAVDRLMTGRRWDRRVVDTRTLAEAKLKYGDSYAYRVPLVAPVEYGAVSLPLPPYLVGALLGNGSVAGSVRIASVADADTDFAALIEQTLPPGVLMVRAHATREGSNYTLATHPYSAPNPVLDAARTLGLDAMKARTKRIPDPYLGGAAADRLALLRGLMDTDGHVAAGNRVTFSTSSEQLALDVQALTRSLGGIAGVSSFDRGKGVEYHVTVNLGSTCPFLLPRKAAKWVPRTNQRPRRAIVSVEPAGEAEVICISVAAADSLYLAGEDYILTHNTTVASIVLTYMACCTLCLKDPQDYYDLLPGSAIAFMQMSTKASQALEVIFHDTRSRIDNSPWFKSRYPRDTKTKNVIRFPKDVNIIPGDSTETSFEGFNVLGGVVDEIDSHKKTLVRDYVESGYSTIHARITSRFGDRGFLLLIGQMKSEGGFAMRKYEEFSAREDTYAVKLAIWESLDPERFAGATFFYDQLRSKVVHRDDALLQGLDTSAFIEIPMEYLSDFSVDPDKALRDLAGIPPKVSDPFIRNTDKVVAARDRYVARLPHLRQTFKDGRLADGLHCDHGLLHYGHIDLAYSSESGDAAGLALGHISHVVDTDEGAKPYIVIDVACRILPPPGRQLELSEVRDVVYQLLNRNYKIRKMTLDGFQCFTGDVKVPLLDGRTLTMAEMAERYPDGGVYVYSYDGSKIAPGLVTKAWRTATKKVVRVVLDNGESVRCTPDHRWMLRDGSYARADELTPGTSLMPLYRDVTPADWRGLRGYERVWQPRDGARGGRKWQFTHRMAFSGYVPAGHVIHHVDHDKRNNDPRNLKLMTTDDHNEHHAQHGSQAFARLWQDPEFRAKTSNAVSRSNSERTGKASRRYRHDITYEMIYGSWLATGRGSWRLVADDLNIDQTVIYSRLREAGFESWSAFRKTFDPAVKIRNHKVVAVLDEGETEDVYDLTVAEHHNFALEAGVFVHNSTDTMQMLRKRRIHTELLSIDKQMLPYQDLRDAIYDERIEFPEVVMKRKRSDAKEVDVLIAELTELGYTPNGLKVDHPPGGSKDIADAVAGTVHNIMQTGRWRMMGKQPQASEQRRPSDLAADAFKHLAPMGGGGALHSPDWRNIGSPWA